MPIKPDDFAKSHYAQLRFIFSFDFAQDRLHKYHGELVEPRAPSPPDAEAFYGAIINNENDFNN